MYIVGFEIVVVFLVGDVGKVEIFDMCFEFELVFFV